MNNQLKFTWDSLSEIRRGHLKTPYDDINLYQVLETPDIEKIILVINREMRKDLFDKERKLLDKLMKMYHLDTCSIGYCTTTGFYDPYELNAKYINGRCPICHKKIKYGRS